jgi:hypothetical protein
MPGKEKGRGPPADTRTKKGKGNDECLRFKALESWRWKASTVGLVVHVNGYPTLWCFLMFFACFHVAGRLWRFCGVGWGMSRFDGLWYSLGGIAVAARDGFGLEE